MDGPGVGTNPDEMLLGAAATCYLITLAAMIERADLPLKEMSLDSEGIVDVTNGVFTYEKIIHKPYVALKADAEEKHYKMLQKLIEKAESGCMISRAFKVNVSLELLQVIESAWGDPQAFLVMRNRVRHYPRFLHLGDGRKEK